MKKINLTTILGILVLIIGILVSLKTLNIIEILDVGFIINLSLVVISIAMILNDRRFTLVPSVVLFIGCWNIFNILGIVTASIYALIWPIILIIVGLSLIFGKKMIFVTPKEFANTAGLTDYNSCFGGIEEKVQSQDFKGLNANAVFAGIELDLREVVIKEQNVQINAYAIFGGVDLVLPKDYNIIMVDNFSLFGGTDNKCYKEVVEGRKNIYINCRAIFGGIELKQ